MPKIILRVEYTQVILLYIPLMILLFHNHYDFCNLS